MRYSQRPRLEQLEDRCVPAGDVFAGIVPMDGEDVLLIQGDQHNNDVAVTVQTDGTIVLEGRDDTTINGVSCASFTPPFLLFPVRVDLGDGGDVVTSDFLNDPAAGRSIDILTGKGDDEVYARGSGSLSIRTDDGSDIVRIEDVVGDLHLDTGDGNDSVEIRNLKAFRSIVDLGRGHDHAVLANLNMFELYFDANAGNDVVECRGNSSIHSLAIINLGDGNDTLEGDSLAGTVFLSSSLIVTGDQGRDALSRASYFDGGPAEVLDGFEAMEE